MKVPAPVHRELLALSVRNAAKSVPLLVVAGSFVAWLGHTNGRGSMALLVMAFVVAAAAWRFIIARRFEARASDDTALEGLERELAANSFLTGAMWASATLCLYPSMRPADGATHLVVVSGSAALAAHFMTLTRWGYPMLVVPSIGALTIVSTFVDATRSAPMAILSVLYVVTLLRSGAQYRETTARAIEHGLALERANLALMRAKENADAGAMAKSQFLATMSHEIRTPMNGVLGSLDVLRRSRLDDEQRKLVRSAAACGEALMSILNDVLDHAKVEAGKIDLTPAPMSVHVVAASVISLFQGNAQAKGLKLRLVIDEEVPEWVVADGQRLKQVLLNLVSNAVKFTSRGSVVLHVRPAEAMDGLVGLQFEVRDTGPGMSDDQMAQLFRPFSQLHEEVSSSQGGTGLGLAISQAMIGAMGGRIVVDSELGEGTTFRFRLQLLPHDMPVPPVVESHSGLLDAMSMLNGTVLVVDDDAVNRLIAKSMLESFGLKVIEASDGHEALALIDLQPIDLVLMDCQMPNMDGYTASRHWREHETVKGLEHVPIIALTANAFSEDIDRAREAGMDAHLSKPYSRLQLRQEVGAWL